MKRLSLYALVILLGLAFVIPSTPSLSAGTLKVTSPNGGNKWKTGKRYAIKWSKGNAGTHVKIQLLKSNKHYKWVSKKTKNDGKHPWKVPVSVATGSAYKIKIVSTKNKKVFDKSNKNFTITKTGDDGGDDDDTDSPAVSLPNGGESWSTGKKYAIKWAKGNAGKFVKIQLLKSGKHHKWITKKTRNDGKHPWKVPDSVTTGSAYTVKITSRTKKTVTDTSNANFTITNASGGDDNSLEMISPNGGESWKKGDVVSIEWEKGTVTGDVRLFLYKSGKRYKTIARSTTNDGLQRWSIPTNMATSSAYKVRVQSKANAKQYDDSDSNFTIAGGTSTTPTVSLSCNSSSASESGGKITCTLELSSSTTKTVTVKTSYSGTATAGTDYSGNKTTHTIAAGKTSTSWKLTGKSDTKTEGNETIVINVTSVTNATESGTQRETLTLTDGKSKTPTISLSCNSSSASESGGKITCTLELSSSTTKTVTVKTSYSGTATAGTDYSGNKTTHTIAAGKTSTSWKLTGKSDTKTEGNETIVINVTSVTNATESGTQRETLTLTDGKSKTPTISLSCNSSSASESGGKITCTLTLSKSTTKTVTVKTSYSGTATAGTDYSGNKTTHTIAAGKTSTSWTLTGKSDSETEGNETIVINVTSFTNATEGDNQKETLTLTDVKSESTITVSSPNGGEKWTGGNKYWIKWDKVDSTGRVKIELLKSGTTALVISNNAKNVGRRKWKIPSSLETDESYKIKITSTTDNGNTDSSDSNFTITKAGTTPTVSLSCTPDSVSEDDGEITCTLSLSKNTSANVIVEMAYSGTATAGTDYSARGGYRRVIKRNWTSNSWTLTGKSDSETEGNETIIVDISSVTNAIEDGTQQATLTLEDADAPSVSLSCTPDSVSEDDGEITCTLSLSKNTSANVIVEMAYSGTATAGTDYSARGGYRRVIKRNWTSNSWTLTGKSDSETEGNETIIVDISSVTNAIEDGTQQATLTLTEP